MLTGGLQWPPPHYQFLMRLTSLWGERKQNPGIGTPRKMWSHSHCLVLTSWWISTFDHQRVYGMSFDNYLREKVNISNADCYMGHHLRPAIVLPFHYFKCSLEFIRWLGSNRCKLASSIVIPGSKVHGANMGPTWGQLDPVGPHVGHMNFAIWDMINFKIMWISFQSITMQDIRMWRGVSSHIRMVSQVPGNVHVRKMLIIWHALQRLDKLIQSSPNNEFTKWEILCW